MCAGNREVALSRDVIRFHSIGEESQPIVRGVEVGEAARHLVGEMPRFKGELEAGSIARLDGVL